MFAYIVYILSIITEYYLTEINLKKNLGEAKDLNGFCKSTLLQKFYPWMLLVWVSKYFNHICELKTIHTIRHLTHVPYIRVGEQVIISNLLILCPNEVLCGYTRVCYVAIFSSGPLFSLVTSLLKMV